MRRRGMLGALAAASATLVLAGCNANPDPAPASTQASGTSKGGTLTIHTSASSVTLDPAKSTNLAITFQGLLVRRLTTWDIQPGKPPKVVPDLATDTGTPSDGGKTWTYKLKGGLKYADGHEIVAADIKYAVERSFAPELSGGLGYHKALLLGADQYKGPYGGAALASIEVPDPKTVVFKLNAPYGDWPWIVSMPAFAPIPKTGDTGPQKFAQDPLASGPYQVESYQQGVSAKLKRNPHWDEKSDPVRTAGPDQIVYLLGQETTVTAQRLIADSGDDKNAFGAGFVPPAQLAQVQQNAAAKSRLVTSATGALAYLAINTRRPNLNNVKVRQAITHAVDRRAYQIAAGGELGGPLASTLITPGIPGRVEYSLFGSDPSGDVAKARALLAEAGNPTLNLSLLVENEPPILTRAQAIQQGLQRVGITVNIKAVEDTVWTAEATGDKGDYDLTLSSWQPDYPSANGNIQPLFATSEIGKGGYNLARYSQPDVDALIVKATGEIDPARAQALWAEADKRILTDAPIVPLIYTRNSFLHGSNVRNFFVEPFPAYPNYLKISLKK